MRLPNFNAGPAAMPLAVLESIQRDLVDFQGRGLSVLEMSHRSDDFAEIAANAKQDFMDLLAIPDDYDVLFMQGGATAQFALTVSNLDVNKHIALAHTGHWSERALRAATPLTEVSVVASLQQSATWRIPEPAEWGVPNAASYLHTTDNETISGVSYPTTYAESVAALGLPVVCDMSSSILSKSIDVNRYQIIYAGAQKNIGPAGITLVIIHKDMIERSRAAVSVPNVFNYAAMSDAGSMLNTPPTFAWYCAGLVFKWLKEQGGLAAMEVQNNRQAAEVYAAIDRYECYQNRVAEKCRSIMNVPFEMESAKISTEFLTGAESQGLRGLKGHKSIGGIRASLYNAMTDESVERLVGYMTEFAEQKR